MKSCSPNFSTIIGMKSSNPAILVNSEALIDTQFASSMQVEGSNLDC